MARVIDKVSMFICWDLRLGTYLELQDDPAVHRVGVVAMRWDIQRHAPDAVTLGNGDGLLLELAGDQYGKTWRLWDAWPDEWERKGEPWQD